ncbi:DUF1236 domain-containing protein [Chelatococcus sambhunathii]|uniref:DUF1236 domain-containing protein n=1 Tax=Chelatococcus sambhunathii TaxID=363953 RepID=A0ABU1DHM8_9HYPH|nr:DUF1236 domain-containing protein [Chelatococcus sambhunathii]MDR4307620.1 DUF1236 domain-containing protein [Chelatococcus sambhunathii]
MKTPTLFAAAAAAIVALTPVSAYAQHSGGGSDIGVKDRADGAALDATDKPTGALYGLGGSSTMRVSVTREHKAFIQERLISLAAGRAVARARLAEVTLTPGHVVPREKVRIRRLPADVVEVAPEYTNYEYFVLEGGAIVIVDPRSYEIVDVISA